MRPLLLLLISAFLASGCTDRVLQYDASRAPLDDKTRIPIQPPFPEGSWRPGIYVHGEVAAPKRIPQEGTIELSNSPLARDQNENDECDDSFTNGARCTVCYLVCAPVAFAAALVILPVMIAKGGLHSDAQVETVSPEQLHARWLSGLMQDRLWTTALDNSYISGLNQALGWREASVEERTIGFWSAPKSNTFYAYISKIVLSDASPGEYALTLCGGSTIHRGWGSNPRSFETCQRTTIKVPEPGDSPANGDALRAALVEQAALLSAVQARELCPSCTSPVPTGLAGGT